MKKMFLVALAALAVSVSAALAASGPINGADKTNGARACSALRTANASAFSAQYASFGSCVSAWAHRAHDARVAATTQCKSQNLNGSKLQACIAKAVASTLAPQVTAAKNAAKACAAERKTLGDAAFEKKYGANGNLRNAFGKCVSGQASSGSGSGGSGGSGGSTAAQHYTITLAPLNNSGVSGSGTLLLNANKLQVNVTVNGLDSNQHAVAIRGLSSGNATCPTASADTNSDGTISLSEGQSFFGAQLLALDAAALSGQQQTVSSSLLPLQSRTIVVLGKVVNGSYDATVPVACGTIAVK
jgi:hypothetical protein